jgi:protein-S-isoprenylcysteine O-methyltransferase Ste14
MQLLPTLSLGLANHWILLAIYAAALILSVARLGKDKRTWLFADPKEQIHGIKKVLLRVGQVVAFTVIVLEALTPLFRAPAHLSVIGLGLYLAGMTMVVVSIFYFGRAPDGRPATDGPYRFSRNPQWVGLFCALLGIAISCGSWLLVIMVVLVGAVYHVQVLGEEQACRAQYGQLYEEYSQQVPRYLFVR